MISAVRETRWGINPRTKTKHLILKRYLKAWLPIMASWKSRIVFIDGFAGPGRHRRGEEGSPIIALRTLLEHPRFQEPVPNREVVFYFIESREDRATSLQRVLNAFEENQPIPSWVKYEVVQDEFASVMTELLDKLDKEGNLLAPTFAFIDPFGYSDSPMEVIARIVQNPNCECLITFMYKFINRTINVEGDPKRETYLDEFFGTDEWREFRKERDPNIRREGITSLYRRQLIEVAGLRHVRTFEMASEAIRTEYFLHFGTNSRKGLSEMKQAMWRADPVKGQFFSDLTDTRQIVMFQPTPDLEELKRLLRERFTGRGWVNIREVSDFVLFDTPYSEAIHLKMRTLKPMEQESPPLINARGQEGRRRRAGTYPDGTIIEFL
jgi:three-Cys-motif partner protein